MKVGIIGRTHILINATKELIKNGHDIGFIYTCKSEPFYKANEDDYKQLAKEIGCPFFYGLDINSNLPILRKLNVDVCISINWLTVLKNEFLNSFKYGVLNAHPGDLPRYKGNACPNWAILNFEEKIGVTIHRMTEELDSGPYIIKDFFFINEQTYIEDIYNWLELIVPQLFVKCLDVLKSSNFIDQDILVSTLRTYPRKPEDSRIKWNEKTRNIMALIRASSYPFEGAFCFLNGVKICIFKARPYFPNFMFSAIPGQVCFALNGNPVISTCDGMIEIEDCIQFGYDNTNTKKNILSSLRNRLT